MNDNELKLALRRLAGEAEGRRMAGAEGSSLELVWRALDDPGPLDPPAGFATQVRARVAQEAELTPTFALWRAPRLVQGLAAGALAAGLVLGVGVGAWVTNGVNAPSSAAATEDGWVVGSSLADSWASVVEEGS